MPVSAKPKFYPYIVVHAVLNAAAMTLANVHEKPGFSHEEVIDLIREATEFWTETVNLVAEGMEHGAVFSPEEIELVRRLEEDLILLWKERTGNLD